MAQRDDAPPLLGSLLSYVYAVDSQPLTWQFLATVVAHASLTSLAVTGREGEDGKARACSRGIVVHRRESRVRDPSQGNCVPKMSGPV